MNNSNKQTDELPKIGAKVFMVHNRYANENIVGGAIIPARVKTYKNVAGKIVPVCNAIGSRMQPDANTHYLYTNIDEAVEAIRTR